MPLPHPLPPPSVLVGADVIVYQILNATIGDVADYGAGGTALPARWAHPSPHDKKPATASRAFATGRRERYANARRAAAIKRKSGCRSVSCETGSPGRCDRRGLQFRPRGQDAELNRSGRRGWDLRLLLDVRGAQHLNLHPRDRQARGFIARQLGREAGSRPRNRDHGGCDGKVSLLHFNSPGGFEAETYTPFVALR